MRLVSLARPNSSADRFGNPCWIWLAFDSKRTLNTSLFGLLFLKIYWLFPSLQMPISAGYRKLQTNAMKAYRKQRQYIYRHCQLCCVTRSCAVIVGVCILMLPMLELATEHVQLKTMCYMDSINHVHPRHMTYAHKPLVLPSLSNVLPAIAFENRMAWSNISYQSTHSRVCHVAISPAPTGLGRRGVGVVVLLLLLMSGDIETNPGPVGEWLF